MNDDESVPVEAITEQRAKGWPDFHPEDFCHRCGRRNIKAWFSPEWPALVGSHSGILCPQCFADHDRDAVWMLTRWHKPDADHESILAAFLRSVSTLGDDAERVASCLLSAGYQSSYQEPDAALRRPEEP